MGCAAAWGRVRRTRVNTSLPNYAPDTQAQIRRTINAKMRGSERQRPDVVQLAKAFGRAVDAKISQGNAAPKAEIISEIMTDYNKAQRVTNCKIEGDARSAVKFLAQCPETVWNALRTMWNDFRVRDSPVTAAILAAPYITAPPSGLTTSGNPKWYNYLLPSAEKHEVWLRRLDGAFRARVDRARREGKAPSLQTRAVAPACTCHRVVGVGARRRAQRTHGQSASK